MASGLTDGPCPCCGSDPSRLELYLDNGFGFTLAEGEDLRVDLVAVETDPDKDFASFYLEQLHHLYEWHQELTDEEWSRWATAIQAAFAHGMEQAARDVGVRFEAADVVAHIMEAHIACRVVFDRIGTSASVDEASAELKHILERGLTTEEAELVGGIRENVARTLEGGHELSRNVAWRLRGPGGWPSFLRWSRVVPVVAPGRTSSSGDGTHAPWSSGCIIGTMSLSWPPISVRRP